MTTTLQIITILLMGACVVATRALPFMLFPSKEKTPRFVRFLGKYLASAVFGMLLVYCLKDVQFSSGNHGAPQLIGILACILLHLWRRNMLLTIAGGTLCYMVLVQTIF
ncbi:MAG: branched-chain amino acid transporter permease [Bacteroidia bacterium]|nr:branched-chain amino acid transporter permease [Bacteroidia bacterium]